MLLWENEILYPNPYSKIMMMELGFSPTFSCLSFEHPQYDEDLELRIPSQAVNPNIVIRNGANPQKARW